MKQVIALAVVLATTSSFAIENPFINTSYDGVLDAPIQRFDIRTVSPTLVVKAPIEYISGRVKNKILCHEGAEKIKLLPPSIKTYSLDCDENPYTWDAINSSILTENDALECINNEAASITTITKIKKVNETSASEQECIEHQIEEFNEVLKDPEQLEVISKSKVEDIEVSLNIYQEPLLKFYKKITYGFSLKKSLTISPAIVGGRCYIITKAQFKESLNEVKSAVDKIYSVSEGLVKISNGMRGISEALNANSEKMCEDVVDSDDSIYKDYEADWDPTESYEGSSVYEN
tara:strand:- start:132 stop:1001 length:870 start_codon:yes stop_codon:yes gene_type:complete